ncbi:MAG: hypothetical protein RLZZ56_654 [Actinomycetota bacterium]|jgi:hypothetical protein
MGSKFIVYVDESGNQSTKSVEPEYPIFVLAMCVFDIELYINQVVPAFQKLKFKWLGHDMTIFHSSDIRRMHGEFAFLKDENQYRQFHEELAECIGAANFEIVHSLIDRRTVALELHVDEVYGSASAQALEKLSRLLEGQREDPKDSCIVFESRGFRQDQKLLSQIKDLGWSGKVRFASKLSVSTGLQIADLVARPIGLSYLSPDSPTKAFTVIENKIFR